MYCSACSTVLLGLKELPSLLGIDLFKNSSVTISAGAKVDVIVEY